MDLVDIHCVQELLDEKMHKHWHKNTAMHEKILKSLNAYKQQRINCWIEN